MANKANRLVARKTTLRKDVGKPKPKRTRSEDSSDNNPDSKVQKPQHKPTSSIFQSSSKTDDSKN